MPSTNLFVLRKSVPKINRVIGDVIDALPSDQDGGEYVNVEGSIWTIITVTDLSEDLKKDFLERRKRLCSPDFSDPMYNALLPKGDGKAGHITTDEATLLNYVEVIEDA